MRSLVLYAIFALISCKSNEPERPNVLLIIMDDQSWEHVSYLGQNGLKTPNIDRMARQGLRFNNAYCPSPSCSPSRAGILTGQDIFRLEEGGVLTGFIRDKFEVFPLILEKNGYSIGNTGKPYWPKTSNIPETHEDPLGKRFVQEKIDAPVGISKNDYPDNFELFLDQKPNDQPFFFWIGISEPHIPYAENIGFEMGVDTALLRVPQFFPDEPQIRVGLSEYLGEIVWADQMIGRILNILEERGLVKNTLVIFTSDNGMPFPRAKATLYDHGVRVPLIIIKDGAISSGDVSEIPVSLIDLAPTILEMTGVEIPSEMTGKSLKNLIGGSSLEKSAQNEFVVTAVEKHTHARPDSLGYPRRAIHTKSWTFIRNYEPNRYPAGDSGVFIPNWDNYGDIDPSRIKTFFKEHGREEPYKRYFDMAFEKVPAHELYNKLEDPDMINNLAYEEGRQEIVEKLKGMLNEYLIENKDPRAEGKSPWDNYYLDH